MSTALVLSGGGAKGSFEIGALQYLYDNGFFAPVICSASVGSVNASQLAHGGSADSQKAAFERLKAIWQTEMTFNEDMYVEASWLRDNVSSRTRAIIVDLYSGAIDVPGLVSQIIFFPPLAIGQAIALGVDLGEAFKGLQKAKSIFTLDPIRAKLEKYLNPTTVANSGVELRLVAVSLDSGAIRYVTQDGRVLETDGRPVAGVNSKVCALERAAYDDALRARNTAQLEVGQARQPQENLDLEIAKQELTRANVKLKEAGRRLNQCMAASQTNGMANRLVVDVIEGVIASSAIPCAFPPVVLGEETYVDGGVRWVLPLKAAFDFNTDCIVAINASPAVLPARRTYRDANLLDIGERVTLEIMLWEIQERHLDVAKAQALQQRRKVWVVTPRIEVHDTFTIDPGLIDINIGYGWMRAADVMTAFAFTEAPPVQVLTPVGAGQSTTGGTITPPGEPSAEQPATPAELEVLTDMLEPVSAPTEGLFIDDANDPALAALADAIAKCRRLCWEIEHEVFGTRIGEMPFSQHDARRLVESAEALDRVRLYKTVLGLLINARQKLNGKLPSDATTWADRWERHQWMTQDVPIVGNTPWSEFMGPLENRPAETRQRSLVAKAPDRDEVFLLTDRKFWITSPAVLERILPGIGFAGVKVIPAEYLDAFPRGEDII